MDNLFIKYMSERAKKAVSTDGNVENPGPVITISRQFGCPAERISEKLVRVLSRRAQDSEGPSEWRLISKEIIEDSAKQLKLTPTLVNDLKEYKSRSFMDHLTMFFSEGFYTRDSQIMMTIAKFIHAAASQGHVVILGRAGEAITQNIKHSLHIKLEAPIDWRVKHVSTEKNISIYDAKDLCEEMDKRRNEFRDHFQSGRADIEFFDVILNTKTLSDDLIVDMIVNLAQNKGLI